MLRVIKIASKAGVIASRGYRLFGRYLRRRHQYYLVIRVSRVALVAKAEGKALQEPAIMLRASSHILASFRVTRE